MDEASVIYAYMVCSIMSYSPYHSCQNILDAMKCVFKLHVHCCVLVGLLVDVLHEFFGRWQITVSDLLDQNDVIAVDNLQ